MKDIMIMIFSTIGAIFVLSSSIGLLRKPDVYMRISVTGKASTLGIGLILASAAIFFNDYSVTTRVIAIIFFVFLTISIGGHMLARAAYFTKTPIWKGIKSDDLAGQYDQVTHVLYSEKHDSSVKPEKLENTSPK
ncbi:monovalent cation/H(+) antiporter subunit G [Aquiflexum sp. TKW24L]|uniref:monovalent cation/H(+) antiporter subunit G n=1 Tax=Aquiflexum sp. TKW24L TaxID=2942212 RepID=UPI0020C04923|nr:monovalent cation/H(+) antiporter subunit G [Aquiflexum sp. TKW24L]MCL6261091.1 monovalent cation/H(+) antiporter subunit G [Aquiflexum sp. TKW24L]